MANTVEGAFTGFFDAINLAGDHRAQANTRRDELVRLLKNKFDVLDAFSTGSIPKFTALAGRADLDVMVVLHWRKHIEGKTPAQVLQSVRDALSEYRTNVRKNGQAVTLHYKTWPNVDVVPVSRTVNSDGTISHYSVPNSNTQSWIPSRPQHLSDAIDRKSKECGPNFRRITKMFKHWNAVHSEYLSGYHVEVLALSVLAGKLDDTPWHMFQFFDKVRPLLEKPLYYDLGYADSNLGTNDRAEVLKRIDTATSKARDAWLASYENKTALAVGLWRQVFGEKFPAYG